jgi:hypothetical protein
VDGRGLTTSVTTPWSTLANATPIEDVNAAKARGEEGSGLEPNALVINRKVAQPDQHR